MPNSYSYDLRLRIIDLVDSGFYPEDAAKRYEVHERTIYRWLAKREKTGNFKVKESRKIRCDLKIKNLKKFEEFVRKNPNRTLKEMAKDYGNISPTTIYNILKKLKFSSKKNKWII